MRWQDPPKSRGDRVRGVDRDVDELKARPGVWALVREGMASTGATQPWTSRGCEATARRNNGRVDIYARWNPDAQPDTATATDTNTPAAADAPEPARRAEAEAQAEPERENLPDPRELGGYLAARAARQERAAQRRRRLEQGPPPAARGSGPPVVPPGVVARAVTVNGPQVRP